MTRVEGTNDYSIVSKFSAASSDFFHDDFLSEMVGKPRSRAPLINWGYYIRYKSLELSFEKAVQFLSSKGTPFQILSIGAGFDTTYFNVQQKIKPENLTFFEIDLPSNVERKVKLIFNSEKCQPLIWRKTMYENDGKTINTDTYRLFACDLSDTRQLERSLRSFKFDFSLPTLVLSECVITYMKEKDSTKLVEFLGDKLENAGFFVYEQCLPDDGFGAFMVEHFKRISSPIHGLARFKTPEEQVLRYLGAGWSKCKVHTLSSIFLQLPPTEIERIRHLQLFDEYEEFFLKCSHYFILVATKGNCDILHGVLNLKNLPQPDTNVIQNSETPLQVKLLDTPDQFKRYGHTLCVGEEESIKIIGGFGEESGKHKRLGSFVTSTLESGHINVENTINNSNFERLYSSCEEYNGRLYLIGGRLNPQTPVKDVLVLDSKTGDLIEAFNNSALDSARWRHATCIYKHYLVIVGGRNTEGTLDEVILFNLNNRNVIKTRLDSPVISGAVSIWGEKILISGGQSPVYSPGTGHTLSSCQESVWIIQLEGEELRKRKILLDLEPRFGHTSHVVGDTLILVGGVTPYGPSGIDCVSLITGEVMRHNLSNIKSNIIMLHNHKSFIKDGKLVIIGGGGNCFSFGTHINPSISINMKDILQ